MDIDVYIGMADRCRPNPAALTSRQSDPSLPECSLVYRCSHLPLELELQLLGGRRVSKDDEWRAAEHLLRRLYTLAPTSIVRNDVTKCRVFKAFLPLRDTSVIRRLCSLRYKVLCIGKDASRTRWLRRWLVRFLTAETGEKRPQMRA